MISALTGELRRILDDRVQVQAGAFLFDVLVPVADLGSLTTHIGQEITFHTILDLEGDPTRGNLAPRLIGFLRPDDKRFFELFTTVKGIGPKKALRALGVPVAQIARAIEARDARDLSQLEGIGKRMAEQIVATLAGKAGAFAAATGPGVSARSTIEEDAILVCMRLGIGRPDAERLLDKVKTNNPKLTSAETISREMLRMRHD